MRHHSTWPSESGSLHACLFFLMFIFMDRVVVKINAEFVDENTKKTSQNWSCDWDPPPGMLSPKMKHRRGSW